jgi:hypothetical protein
LFNGGQKDFHLTDKIENFEPYPFMNENNTLIINTDHMKNLRCSLNHQSFFYSKYFMDSFTVFLAKIMIMENKMEEAKKQMFKYETFNVTDIGE